MDDIDAERVAGWLRTWGVEAVLGAVALVGLVEGAVGGDRLVGLLGVALLVAVADRLRLRLDNRSLAAAVEEVREGRVSAARGGSPTGTTAAAATTDTSAEPNEDAGGDGATPGGATDVDATTAAGPDADPNADEEAAVGDGAVDRVGSGPEPTDGNAGPTAGEE